MSTRGALARLAAANPIPDRHVAVFLSERWSEDLLARILTEPVAVGGRTRRFRRAARLVLVGTVVAALLAVPTYAVGWGLIGGWLSGEPAPQSVMEDFGSYTPHLGFHPNPGHAVLVAEEAEISLYATTNEEGSYCLIASAPWKRPEKLPDGGTCLPVASTTSPLIAGLVGASSNTLLIAGRVDNRNARTIQFSDPSGDVIKRPIGTSGFFIAAVHVRGSACADGDWEPTFSAFGVNGQELVRGAITLGYTGTPGVCSFASPHP